MSSLFSITNCRVIDYDWLMDFIEIIVKHLLSHMIDFIDHAIDYYFSQETINSNYIEVL